MSEPHHGGVPAASAPVVIAYGRHAPDDPPPPPPAPDLVTVETETRHYRHDGWTPALRATFLDMLARSGVVTDACREVQRSATTAYALRNRDRLFAAGWDAALSMARARLADELNHRAINGMVEQVWKNGEIVAERHHHDNRLSIAVLNRLDARADRAERSGAPAQRIAAQWDSYLAALTEDRIADAEALLAPPPPTPVLPLLGHGSNAMLIHQLHQLRAGHALDEAAPGKADGTGDDDGDGDEQRVWIENHTWRTSYPPPVDFLGDEDGEYGDMGYNRQCTPGEWEVLDACYPNAFDAEPDEQRAADEADRDAFFAALAGQVERADALRDDPGSVDPDDAENVASPPAVGPEPVDGRSFPCPAEQQEPIVDEPGATGGGHIRADPPGDVSRADQPRPSPDSS